MFDAPGAAENLGRKTDLQLMLHFCQPAGVEETELDKKLLAAAEEIDMPFEGQVLKCYRWGQGRPVLLVHGWSSRASHLAFLGRSLAKSGFEVIAFDAPAHGRSAVSGCTKRSSLPEFCRAIYHIAGRFGPIYGLVGHSFGGAAAAFTAAGQANIAGYRVDVEKLVLISSPSSIGKMISYYCRNQRWGKQAEDQFIRLLEQEFPLKVKDYEVSDALGRITAGVLVVHDRDDKEVDLEDTRSMVEGNSAVKLVVTAGEGHRRILVSRALLRAVKDFL